MTYPIILNFDQSVGEINNAKIIDVTQWQDTIRFGCSEKKFCQFKAELQQYLHEHYCTVFM